MYRTRRCPVCQLLNRGVRITGLPLPYPFPSGRQFRRYGRPNPAVASQIPSIGGLGAIIAVDFAIELALARDMFGDA